MGARASAWRSAVGGSNFFRNWLLAESLAWVSEEPRKGLDVLHRLLLFRTFSLYCTSTAVYNLSRWAREHHHKFTTLHILYDARRGSELVRWGGDKGGEEVMKAVRRWGVRVWGGGEESVSQCGWLVKSRNHKQSASNRQTDKLTNRQTESSNKQQSMAINSNDPARFELFELARAGCSN